MSVEVTAKTVEPAPTAVVAAATTRAEFPAIWGPMLDQVWSFLRGGTPAGLYQHGHNIMLYKDDVPNVEVGVQVTGSFDPAGDVVPSTLPGGLVATATHTGPIATIGDTHQAVREWSNANGYRLVGPHWEIYGDPDPSSGHFDVQVFWSLVAPIQLRRSTRVRIHEGLSPDRGHAAETDAGAVPLAACRPGGSFYVGQNAQGPSMYEMEGPCSGIATSVRLVAQPSLRCTPTAGAEHPFEAPASRSSARPGFPG